MKLRTLTKPGARIKGNYKMDTVPRSLELLNSFLIFSSVENCGTKREDKGKRSRFSLITIWVSSRFQDSANLFLIFLYLVLNFQRGGSKFAN